MKCYQVLFFYMFVCKKQAHDLPLDVLLVPQHSHHLLPAPLLDGRLAGQVVQEPRDA
jgi:hypothetical protein